MSNACARGPHRLRVGPAARAAQLVARRGLSRQRQERKRRQGASRVDRIASDLVDDTTGKFVESLPIADLLALMRERTERCEIPRPHIDRPTVAGNPFVLPAQL